MTVQQASSLLKQGDFFSNYLPAIMENEEKSGNFTGARLQETNSAKYDAIVYLSAEGLGAIRIGKILAVSPNTVLAVRDREAPAVDIQKHQIAQRCRSAARLCLEAILDQLTRDSVDKIPVKDLGILLGILADKAELLSGGPTQRIEVTQGATHEDVARYLMGLRAAAEKQRAVDVEILQGPDLAPAAGPDPERTGADPRAQAAGQIGPGAGGQNTEPGQSGAERPDREENRGQIAPGGPSAAKSISEHPGNPGPCAPAPADPGGEFSAAQAPAAGQDPERTGADPRAMAAGQDPAAANRADDPPISGRPVNIDPNHRPDPDPDLAKQGKL